jgi:hypothetical protein
MAYAINGFMQQASTLGRPLPHGFAFIPSRMSPPAQLLRSFTSTPIGCLDRGACVLVGTSGSMHPLDELPDGGSSPDKNVSTTACAD